MKNCGRAKILPSIRFEEYKWVITEIMKRDRSLILQIFLRDTTIITMSTNKKIKLKGKFEIIFHEVSRGS
jgi:hypothetical protein